MSAELRSYLKESCVKCTGGGIYTLHRLQIKRSGRLDQKAVLALDCCPSITQNVHMKLSYANSSPQMSRRQTRIRDFHPLEQHMLGIQQTALHEIRGGLLRGPNRA